MVKRRPKPKTITSKRVQDWKKIQKDEPSIIREIKEHLLKRKSLEDGDRDKTKLHPSEIANSQWCRRYSYYVISGEPETDDSSFSFELSNIFEEGKDIHKKWQKRIDDLGKLHGTWECLNCHYYWWETSPRKCPDCGTENRDFIKYREVPLESEEYMIIGHADGEVEEALIEVKSIGLGTLRFEAPQLLKQYEVETVDGKTVVDVQGLWRDIKRPFPGHTRQGMIYLLCRGKKSILFIYEFKPTQQVKGFILSYNEELIADILEQALDVKYALKKGAPPDRPEWAEDEESKGCVKCTFKTKCWGLDGEKTSSPRSKSNISIRRKVSSSRTLKRSGVSKGQTKKAGAKITGATRRRNTISSKQTIRDRRSSANEPNGPSNGLGGLLKRATRSS